MIKYLLAFLLAVSSTVFSEELTQNESPRLVVNSDNKASTPRNFRTTDRKLKNSSKHSPSTEGFYELRASASSQFSEKGFEKIIAKIDDAELMVIDLRQESHGFIDGTAVSWFIDHNWANNGKTYSEVIQDEEIRLNELKNHGHVKLIHNGSIIRVPFSTICSERELIESKGYQYTRIPVTDHKKPTDESVDLFIATVLSLPKKSWLHFHCNAGMGRATTFLVMYDIMRNGHLVSLKDIYERQALLGGKDFSSPISKESWKAPYQQERLALLEQFYRYWNETKGTISWTEWNLLNQL